jgi:hypothetical protein
MSFDLQAILKRKRALRCELVARPVAEKLRMLDALHERALAIRLGMPGSGAGILRDEPPPHGKSHTRA